MQASARPPACDLVALSFSKTEIAIIQYDVEPQVDYILVWGTRNRALLSLVYDFLARRSELVAIRSADLKFTPDEALQGMIEKVKPTNRKRSARVRLLEERKISQEVAWIIVR